MEACNQPNPSPLAAIDLAVVNMLTLTYVQQCTSMNCASGLINYHARRYEFALLSIESGQLPVELRVDEPATLSSLQ